MYQKNHKFHQMADQKSHSGSRSNNNHPIVQAATYGDIEKIKRELAANDFSNDDYVSAISRAGGHGHMQALKLLTSQPFNRMEDNERAIRWAARHGKFECLQYFIEELKTPASCFNSASLRIAAQHGHLREMIYLHNHGADLHAYNNEAIKSAVRFYHDDIGEFLIHNGVNFSLNKSDFENDSRRNVEYTSGTNTGNFEVDRWDMFYRAATKGESMDRTFKAMLETEVPQIAIDTAAVKVASYGLVSQYKLLRLNGANVNFQNVAGLSEAARFGHKDMVIHFLDEEKTLDRQLGVQRALKKAIEGNHDEVAQTLMLRITNETGGIGNSDILIDRFLRFQQMASAQELINQNHWLISESKDVPVKIVQYGSADLLKACINSGMQIMNTEVNFVDAALERNNFENARILLEEGVSPSDLNGCMVSSAKFGKLDILAYMLEAGARAEFNNSEALSAAIQYDHIDSAKFLIAYGAQLNQSMHELCKSNEMRGALALSNSTIKGDVTIIKKRKKVVNM